MTREAEAPAARFRRVAGGFSRVAAATEDWEAPTPVPEWVARDVIAHLLGWFPPFLHSGSGIELPPGPSVSVDPAAAWEQHSAALLAVLDDPATADRMFAHVHLPEVSVPEAVDHYYTTDVLMHTWDLARAGDLDDGLDPDECEALLTGMLPMEEVLRTSGHYGPKHRVAEDASPVLRLMAFVGRDPDWQPALQHHRPASQSRQGVNETVS